MAIGKAGFDENQLLDNYTAVIDEIVRAKPSSAKGKYIVSCTLASSMGPGIRVDARSPPTASWPGVAAGGFRGRDRRGAGERLDCVAAQPRPPAGQAHKPGAGKTMNREEKSTTIQEIAAQIEGSEAIFAVDYRGISVHQAAELRSKLREADASFRVVKNRLTKLAADKAGEERLAELLQGPTALAFVRGDTAQAAKRSRPSTKSTTCSPTRAASWARSPSTPTASKRSRSCPPAKS
jgi:hypothetical protein